MLFRPIPSEHPYSPLAREVFVGKEGTHEQRDYEHAPRRDLDPVARVQAKVERSEDIRDEPDVRGTKDRTKALRPTSGQARAADDQSRHGAQRVRARSEERRVGKE